MNQPIMIISKIEEKSEFDNGDVFNISYGFGSNVTRFTVRREMICNTVYFNGRWAATWSNRGNGYYTYNFSVIQENALDDKALKQILETINNTGTDIVRGNGSVSLVINNKPRNSIQAQERIASGF